MRVKYLILGAGPTGLGAAHRLQELGCHDFLVLEKNTYPGGLSASFRDAAGFTWDVGGHVVFSHYAYFDHLLESLLGNDCLQHQRRAFIRLANRWVPYPFQNNIRHLPRELQWECIEGLLSCNGRRAQPKDFKAWINKTFGPGIARLFMLPYNFKVWAHPPETMDWQWIGERVSVVDVKRVLQNLVLGEDDVSWGPNNLFTFPLKGGTGEIFGRLADRVADKVRYDQSATEIDPRTKTVRTAAGVVVSYDSLLNTTPVDLLVQSVLHGVPEAVTKAAEGLEHNSVHVHGIGLDRPGPTDKCWMYFPEDDCPFYRVTNFHHYSPNNTPRPGRQTALMAEVSSSPCKPVPAMDLCRETLAGLENTTLMDPSDQDRILSTWEIVAEHGYPIPTPHRDASLGIIQPWLESQNIFSRGRFGGWKYEVGNMDHSVMQGVEWAERVVLGKPEETYAS